MRRKALLLCVAGLAVLFPATHIPAVTSTGMVLQTSRPQYDYGALVLTYLSTNTKKTLVSLASGAPNWQGCWGASFSPDGRKIAYAYNYSEVWTIDIDGNNKKKICDAQGKEQYMTWTADGYLWWGQCDTKIYRVKADGSQTKPEVMYTYTTNVHNLGVSQDGKVATWTYPSWLNAGYDFTAKKLYDFGFGCHDPCSPDGKLMTFNTGGHTVAYVTRFPTQEKVYTINPAESGATANLHRYSHSSNDFVMYTLENSNKGYLVDLRVDPPNKATLLGPGLMWDYYPDEITGGPVAKLGVSKDALAFTATPGKPVSPAEIIDSVVNKTVGTTLATVTATSSQPWLTVTVLGTGNSQYTKNVVDATKIPTQTLVNATVKLKAGPTDSASYTVTVDARPLTREPVIVSQPASGAVYKIGDTLTVAWDADCQQVPGVKVELSLDGGDNYSIIEVSGALKCGVQTWKYKIPTTISVPSAAGQVTKSTASTTCKVMVANYNGAGQGESQGTFTIAAAGAALSPVRSSGVAVEGIRVARSTPGRLSVEVSRAGGYAVELMLPNGTVVASGRFSGVGTYQMKAGRATGTYLLSVRSEGRATVQRTTMVNSN